MILYVSQEGEVIWTDHYCASGTGSQIAMAFLNQRPYDDLMNPGECLFRVLEAKVAAEKNPYVGIETVVWVSTPSSPLCVVDPAYVKGLIETIEKRRDELPSISFDPKFVRPAQEVIAELTAHTAKLQTQLEGLNQDLASNLPEKSS